MDTIFQRDVQPFLVRLGLRGAVYVLLVTGHRTVLLLLRKCVVVVKHWHRS